VLILKNLTPKKLLYQLEKELMVQMQLILEKNNFINSFISPLSRISNSCKITIGTDRLTGIVVGETGTPILISKYNMPISEGIGKSINILDLKKFKQIINCINESNIELNIDNNFSTLKYSDKHMSFKMHLSEDNLMPKISISESKIDSIKHDVCLDIPKEEILKLIKASSFATEAKKVYFYIKDNTLFAELTDRTVSEFDSLIFSLIEDVQNKTINDIPFDFTILRYLVSHNAESIKLKINNEFKVLFFEIDETPIINNYIISAFVS
jgi:hypothetical protein